MLETAWESRWLPELKKKALSFLYRTDMFQWVERKAKPVKSEKTERTC